MAIANTSPETPQADFAYAAKSKLLRQQKTITELARDLGLARNTVSIAINHPSMLPTVKARISRALALPF